MTEVRWLEAPKRDYALIYSKLARHVAAASAFLVHDDPSRAKSELIEALTAIHMFEAQVALITDD